MQARAENVNSGSRTGASDDGRDKGPRRHLRCRAMQAKALIAANTLYEDTPTSRPQQNPRPASRSAREPKSAKGARIPGASGEFQPNPSNDICRNAAVGRRPRARGSPSVHTWVARSRPTGEGKAHNR